MIVKITKNKQLEDGLFVCFYKIIPYGLTKYKYFVGNFFQI